MLQQFRFGAPLRAIHTASQTTARQHRTLRRLHSVNARAARLPVLLAPIVLMACPAGHPRPARVRRDCRENDPDNSLAIMLAIVIPTIAATLAFAWWFRASNLRARYLPDWAYSGRIELIV